MMDNQQGYKKDKSSYKVVYMKDNAPVTEFFLREPTALKFSAQTSGTLYERSIITDGWVKIGTHQSVILNKKPEEAKDGNDGIPGSYGTDKEEHSKA
jgi:hypothetical protein